MTRIVQWLWGPHTSNERVILVKSWWPSWDSGGTKRWQDHGIAWPVMLIENSWTRMTVTPIWNFIWLRNRLGFPEKMGEPGPM